MAEAEELSAVTLGLEEPTAPTAQTEEPTAAPTAQTEEPTAAPTAQTEEPTATTQTEEPTATTQTEEPTATTQTEEPKPATSESKEELEPGVQTIYPEDNDLLIQERQSPIDLKETKAIPTDLPKLQFLNHQPNEAVINLTNRKNSVSISLSDVKPRPCLVGGPTKVQYCMSEAHLHWGESEDEGSEHLLNRKSFPAELHVVYTIPRDEVTPKRPEFLVTGYFLEVCNEDNPLLKTLIDGVKRVIPYGSVTSFDAKPLFTLINMMKDQPTYYTYPGSLTTAPYTEVTWIVFPQPTTISYYQLQQLREIQDSNGDNVLSNFREVFPLGRRKLLKAKTGNYFRRGY